MLMVFWIMGMILLVLLGMGGVAFLTLLERKILGLSQVRLGPNKVVLLGILQPISDGVKLLFKEMVLLIQSMNLFYVMMPMLILILFLFTWVYLLPWSSAPFMFKHSSLLFFALLGISAYAVVLTGWSTTSNFSKLGSLRSLLQSLSFEVAIILLFMNIMKSYSSLSFGSEVCPTEFMAGWVSLWMILSLMESNRAPFDLVEGESELISGFNVEVGSLGFVFLFLSEYGMVLVMSILLTISLVNTLSELMMASAFLVLLIRSCFPRIRYDIMMTIMWSSILPITILVFFPLTLTP